MVNTYNLRAILHHKHTKYKANRQIYEEEFTIKCTQMNNLQYRTIQQINIHLSVIDYIPWVKQVYQYASQRLFSVRLPIVF